MRKIRSNPQYFVNSLMKVEWDKLANMVWDVDEMVNFFTSSIISTLDKTAPVKERKIKSNFSKEKSHITCDYISAFVSVL